MPERSTSERSGARVLLVAPQSPPYGGMAAQAALLEEYMNREDVPTGFLPSNLPFPKPVRFLELFRGVRALFRCAVLCVRLWRLCRQVDVIHVLACSGLYFFAVVSPTVLIGRLRRKRVVLTYHGGHGKQFLTAWRVAVRPVFKICNVVTAPSNFLADVIRSQISVPVSIIPNVIDLSRFTYRQRSEFRPRLLVTRHLEKIYDIESVLRAFRRIQETYTDASLWIAGTGSDEQHLRKLVSEWRLSNVYFLGHIAYDDLPQVYDQCDILLNASRVDNFPGALIEASAAGLVVVSTSPGGIPFLYENERTALLVQPGDWPALAQAAIRAVDCPMLGSRLVEAAAEVARACDWKRVRLALYRAYGHDIGVFAEDTLSNYVTAAKGGA